MNVWAAIAFGLTLLLLFEVLKPYVQGVLSRLDRRRSGTASRGGGSIRCPHCSTENDGTFNYCRNCLRRLDAAGAR